MWERNLSEQARRFLGFLGLGRRAGKIICGTPLVCLALAKEKKPPLVLYSCYASEGTRKRIESKCRFYGVSALPLPIPTEVLAHSLGKTGCLAALAVTDEQIASAIQKKAAALPSPTDEPTQPDIPNSTGKEASPNGSSGITV